MNLSLQTFASGCRDHDAYFAGRVRRFENRFGPADADTLAVLAQAAYFCWFEKEYEADFLNVCCAIDRGHPTSMYLCLQITPARWDEINTYLIGVERWLGHDAPVPDGLDTALLDRIDAWLGERTPVREALAGLLLCYLTKHLFNSVLTRLADADAQSTDTYRNYSNWYLRPDGGRFTAAWDADLIDRLKEDIRAAMADAPEEAEALIEGIIRESQPPCMHRFARYLQIKVASIGALCWRGHLPPDDVEPKHKAGTWLSAAVDAVRQWIDGEPPSTVLAQTVHAALGDADERKRAIAEDFLLAKRTADTTFCRWLNAHATERRFKAEQVFALSRTANE